MSAEFREQYLDFDDYFWLDYPKHRLECSRRFRQYIFNHHQFEKNTEFNKFLNFIILQYWKREVYPTTLKYREVQEKEQRRLRKLKEQKIKEKKNLTKTYILKDNTNNTYKIGKSINPLKREKTLQSEKPNLKLIKIFENNIEKELHGLYKDCRLRGEWFKLNNVQLEYICKNYK